MEGINKKVCSTCGRKRKDHPTPFGKNCVLVPLTQDEREQVLREVQADDQGGSGSNSKSPIPDDEQEIDKQLAAIRAESLKLEASRKEAAEKIRLQEAALSVKRKQDELLKAQEYLASLKLGLETDQRRLIELDAGLNSTSPGVTLPAMDPVPGVVPPSTLPVSTTAVHTPALPATATGHQTPLARPPVTLAQGIGQVLPVNLQPQQLVYSQAPLQATPSPTYTVPASVSQRDGPFVIPAPPPPISANHRQAFLDPAQQVYAQASVGQYGVQPAVAQPRPPGATAARLMQENPGLAAAAGCYAGAPALAAEPNPPGGQTSGKSVAENFIYKAVAKEKDRPTFYEFIHGALRLIKYRIKYDKKSALEHIIYYERLCNLACQYRWHAVFDLHTYWSNEVEEERASWDEEIPGTDIARYCHGYDQVRAPQSDEPESRKNRKNSVRNRSRDNVDRADRSSSDGGQIREGLCRRYNKDPAGCRFGGNCQFHHRCSECDARGLKEVHPAMWCHKSSDGASAPGSSASSR